MLDTVTLDQLRVFITVVDEGNFSAAARKLRRVQSAISQSMSNLEIAVGVTLWDRSTKIPTLTEQGRSLLGAARRVCGEADAFRKLAQGLSTGIEASVSLCVDAFFPIPALVEVCQGITKEFPFVDLRVDTQPTSSVYARVLSRSATIGVVSPLGIPPGLESRLMAPIRMMPVVAVEHPLARHEGRIAAAHFVEHVQIVLANPREEPPSDQSVLSTRTFSVADLATKHALIRAGLGWGNLPAHVVMADIQAKRLSQLHPEPWGENEYLHYLSAVYYAGQALGPVHQWILKRLETLCPRDFTPDVPIIKSRRSGARKRAAPRDTSEPL